MKKLIGVLCLMATLLCVFVACGKSYTKTEWVFSNITKVELKEVIEEEQKNELFEEYNVSDVSALEAAVKAEFIADGVYSPSYVKFIGSRAYVYDAIMEREATYCYYALGENDGFFSVFADLDTSAGNLDKSINPPYVYNPTNNTFSVTFSMGAFYVEIEFVAK